MIIGDFNFCQQTSSTNVIGSFLRENNFAPLIIEPTHIEGNILDQAHFRDIENIYSSTAQLHTKYYTDHKGLGIVIKKGLYYNEIWCILLICYIQVQICQEAEYTDMIFS